MLAEFALIPPTPCLAHYWFGDRDDAAGFEEFFGTSAAAPVAAAIATIVRAACFPKVGRFRRVVVAMGNSRAICGMCVASALPNTVVALYA